MKIARGILLIFLISISFFLCKVSSVFALFRDDMSIEEAEELISSEREKSRIKWEERERKSKAQEKVLKEEEPLQFEEAITAEEKQVPSSVIPLAKEAPSGANKKAIIGAVLFVVAIIILFGSKLLFTNKSEND